MSRAAGGGSGSAEAEIQLGTSEPAEASLRAVLFYRKKEPGSKGAKAASGDQDTSSQIRHRPARCCFYLSGETAASRDHAGSRDKAVREIHFIYKIFLLQTDYRNKNRRCNRCMNMHYEQIEEEKA